MVDALVGDAKIRAVVLTMHAPWPQANHPVDALAAPEPTADGMAVKVQTPVTLIFPMHAFPQAMKCLIAGELFGKIVVTINPTETD